MARSRVARLAVRDLLPLILFAAFALSLLLSAWLQRRAAIREYEIEKRKRDEEYERAVERILGKRG